MKPSLIAILCILFASCSVNNMLTLNVEKPAQIALPANTKNVVVVNNTPIHVAFLMDAKPPQHIIDEALLDDSVKTILTEAFTQFLGERETYNWVDIYNMPSTRLSFGPINKDSVRQICNMMEADALISIDNFATYPTISEIKLKNGLAYRMLQVKTEALFSVYDWDAQLLSAPMLLTDSLSWEQLLGEESLSPDLPSKEAALREAAIYTAEKMDQAFASYWEEQDRFLYSDMSTKMNEATMCARANRWDDALDIWTDLYENEKNVLKKARLAFNIALGYEVVYELQDAMEWINTSYDLFVSKGVNVQDEQFNRTIVYKQELEQRIKESEIFDQQEAQQAED